MSKKKTKNCLLKETKKNIYKIIMKINKISKIIIIKLLLKTIKDC